MLGEIPLVRLRLEHPMRTLGGAPGGAWRPHVLKLGPERAGPVVVERKAVPLAHGAVAVERPSSWPVTWQVAQRNWALQREVLDARTEPDISSVDRAMRAPALHCGGMHESKRANRSVRVVNDYVAGAKLGEGSMMRDLPTV